MSNHFPFQIIDGYLATNGKGPHRTPRLSAGFPSANHQVLQHLVGDAAESNLPRVVEGFQKRLDALLHDRIRIGRHLHDCVLRPLLTIGLRLHRQTYRGLSSVTPSACGQSIEQLNKAIHETRRIIRDLEEGEIQEFDLMSEISSMIATYELLGQLQIESIIEPQTLQLLTQEEKHELFTITREALSNCIRHAHATRATVKLHQANAKLYLAILDNGIGFSSGDTQRGYGLSNIETRARKLGGRLRIRSRKGRGTAIIVQFVLEPMLTPL
jgi:two-component system nitrate/nitrite sensor histidine kinase NarX